MIYRYPARLGKKLSRRAGFTLAEVMVAATILAIIASIAVPNLLQYLDDQKYDASKAQIDSIVVGVARFKTGVTKYPYALHHLTDSITTSNGAPRLNTQNSCSGYAVNSASRYYVPANVTSWRNNGPFFSRPLDSDGYFFGVGTFNDIMERSPGTIGTGAAGTLQLVAPGVNTADIDAIEMLYDPVANSSAGVIRWSTPVDGTATMTYVMGINGC